MRLPRKRAWTLLLAASALLALAVAAQVRTPDALDIGSRRELFVDRFLVESMDGTLLRLHEPQPRDVAIRIDHPWEGWYNIGGTVFFHGGRYRMYYRCIPGTTVRARQATCYAESPDGIRWTKPALDAVAVAGAGANNLVAGEDGGPIPSNLDVFLDSRPGVPVSEQIKAVYYLAGSQRLTPTNSARGVAEKRGVFLVSADGVRFRRMEPQPVLASTLENSFDSQNLYFWSPAEGQYVGYFRHSDPRRSAARVTSPDLMRWSAPVPMTYGDTRREQIYTTQTLPYFRAPHIYVALAARFLEGRPGHPSEGVLMSTRAGSTQFDRTFMEAFVRPGLGEANWAVRSNFPLWGIVQTGPAEISFYVNREYGQSSWHIRRYALRLDGFASVHAPYAGGVMITRPFRFSGSELELNVATSAAGAVRVEIQDAGGRPIPGYTLADAQEIMGDDVARVAAWRSGTDVRALAGRAVRLRFVMRDADLYSLRFR